MTLPPCEFYPDGKHRFIKAFWGWACDRCGRISDFEEGVPMAEEEQLLTT